MVQWSIDSGPLIPTCIALVDDRLPSDDDDDDDDGDDDDSDGEESDSEGDLALDEYTVSESEWDDEWIHSSLGQCILLALECLSNFILAGCILLEFT